jgi:hypothetical protein
MEFGPTINNPLLQAAVSVGEKTIRTACEAARGLDIHVEMEQCPDGRDAIRVTLRSQDSFGAFCMVLRKYFDGHVLRRVARHAWQRRIPCGSPDNRFLTRRNRPVLALMN